MWPTSSVYAYVCVFAYVEQPRRKDMAYGIFLFRLLAFSSPGKCVYSLAVDLFPQYETPFLWTPSIDRRPPAL